MILNETRRIPPVASLEYFLLQRKDNPTTSIVIGNEAGDADTIVSAIALAYIESVFQPEAKEQKTPIVSIPHKDLLHRRPDVKLLLHLAGLSDLKSTLLFVDNDEFMKNLVNASVNVTLVDHNELEVKFQSQKHWKVTEIVDHHPDEGLYLDTCHGDAARTIAFADEHALVASACTLVAERLREVCLPPYPTSVSLLLLGVILLDSVNLDEAVGKVTSRDRSAVANLLTNTDWLELPPSTQALLSVSEAKPIPNRTVFFHVLQSAKYDSGFWKSLSTEDALRYDYKDYEYNDGTKTFGISTVLTSADVFFRRKHYAQSVLGFIKASELSFLGIMFAYEDEVSHQLVRQFGICAELATPTKSIVDYLLTNTDLQLEKIRVRDLRSKGHSEEQGLSCRLFHQRNIQDSRKQIAPFIFEALSAS